MEPYLVRQIFVSLGHTGDHFGYRRHLHRFPGADQHEATEALARILSSGRQRVRTCHRWVWPRRI